MPLFRRLGSDGRINIQGIDTKIFDRVTQANISLTIGLLGCFAEYLYWVFRGVLPIGFMTDEIIPDQQLDFDCTYFVLSEIGENGLRTLISIDVESEFGEFLSYLEKNKVISIDFLNPEHCFQVDSADPYHTDDQFRLQGGAVELLAEIDNIMELYCASVESGSPRDMANELLAIIGRLVMLQRRAKLMAIEQREIIEIIREGARKGGVKSSLTRTKNSKVPPPHELAAIREREIGKGTAHQDIAARLAARFECSPTHIRQQLKKVRKDNQDQKK